MPWDFNITIREETKKLGLDFLSSPFEPAAVDYLESIGGVDAYKVASMEVTDSTLLRAIGKTGRPVILSTGMGSKEEIMDAFHELKEAGAGPISVLKCTSAYPATFDQAHMLTIKDWSACFPSDTVLGVSDHTLGVAVPVTSMVLGGRVVEKHYILRRSDGGPDSTFSVEPHEWKQMVDDCNAALACVGSVTYGGGSTEVHQFRRSLFAVKDIKKGEDLVPGLNVAALRPNIGLHPKHLDGLAGKKAARDMSASEKLTWDCVDGGEPKTECPTMGHSLGGKRVLITGGTGTIGNEMVKYMAGLPEYPKEVVVISRDELKQHEMRSRFAGKCPFPLRLELGDIRDRRGLRAAMLGCDVVLHAAALKQVPAVEDNPYEGIMTNVMGTQNIADLAVELGVARCLLICTDKACMPSNAYGATKMLAERIFLAANAQNKTRFSLCRYGNVFGSRGSIVPVIHQLLKMDPSAPVSLTDARMTRFTLTGSRAVDLVMGSLDNMLGGDVFVPKLPAYKVTDLLAAMGVKKDQIVITGIRPGEKIHETMLFDAEAEVAQECGDWFYRVPGPTENISAMKYSGIGRYHSGNPGTPYMTPQELEAVYKEWVATHLV